MARRRLVRPHPAPTHWTNLLAAPATNAGGQRTVVPTVSKTVIPGQLIPIPTPPVKGIFTGGQAVSGLAGAPAAVAGAAGGAIISGLAPYLKIAVGALGLMVAGVTIVYVAGKKTGVTGAIKNVATATAPGKVGEAQKSIRRKVASKSPTPAGAAGQALNKPSRTPARPDVAHDRERARRARLEGAESLARTRRAKAETARSEARVGRAYATEARRAKGAQVLNRPRALPRQSRPKRTTARVA